MRPPRACNEARRGRGGCSFLAALVAIVSVTVQLCHAIGSDSELSMAREAHESRGLSNGVPAPAPHLTMMSFYGYNASAMDGWITHGVSRNMTQLLQGRASHGIAGLLRLDGTSAGILDRNTSTGRFQLTRGWQQAWADVFADASPHISSGALVGFFVGDELTAQGLPFAQLEALVDAIAATLRGGVGGCAATLSCMIYYNDSDFAMSWPYVPRNLTHFSFDYYHGVATGLHVTVWQLYKARIEPLLGNSTTRMLLVPQAFGSALDPARPIHVWSDWMLANLTQYVTWANSDTRFVGFTPWHLDDRPAVGNCSSSLWGCEEIGALGMPDVRDAFQTLGRAIVANREGHHGPRYP